MLKRLLIKRYQLVQYSADGIEKDISICMTLGVDLPTRNALSGISKLNPKVFVMTWPESKHGFRCASIIKCDGGIGIWAAAHSNLRVI